MHDLDMMKKKLELSKVKCGKEEMEYRILEREADIKRLKDSIIIQDTRINELTNELKE